MTERIRFRVATMMYSYIDCCKTDVKQILSDLWQKKRDCLQVKVNAQLKQVPQSKKSKQTFTPFGHFWDKTQT